jgi:hypothetical protein
MSLRRSVCALSVLCTVVQVRVASAQTPARGFSMKAAAGANYARVFTVPTYGGEVSVAAGGRYDNTFTYGGFALERSRTEMGLPIWGGHMSLALEQKFGIVRAGIAGRLGYWNIERASGGEALQSLSIGAAARGSVDLFSAGEGGAVFLQGELRADYYGDPLVLGPNLSLGYRWDAKPRRRVP